jgi:predicted outer membrane lipoprotein
MSEPLRIVVRGLVIVAGIWLLWFAFLDAVATGGHDALGYFGWLLGGPLAIIATVVVLTLMCIRAVDGTSQERRR